MSRAGPQRRDRVVRGVLLVAALYVVARFAGWTGTPHPVEFHEPLLVPAVILTTAWGLARLLARSAP